MILKQFQRAESILRRGGGMIPAQVVARDLRIVLGELRALEKGGKLDPMVAAMLKTMIRLVELLARQVRQR